MSHAAAQKHHLEIDFDSVAEAFGMADTYDFFAELKRGFYAKTVTHEKRQAALARDMENAPVLESIGAVPKATIDAASYHYWGQTLGYECWEDEEFLREYLRDNPLARVRPADRAPCILNQWGTPAREAA